MKIIRAGAQDSAKIAPLFDRYRQFYGRPSDLDSAHGFLHERLTRDESVIFFAVVNDLPAGFVQLYPSFSSISMKRLWVLNDLFVEPDVRRCAVGRELLHRAEAFARETQSKGLTLKTATDNKPAQSLYESLGWKKDEIFLTYDLTLAPAKS